jgi:type IV secretory pathway TrbL component
MKAVGLAAIILAVSLGSSAAQQPSNKSGSQSGNSASQYAPGQKQKEPGDAKKFAPGQKQKEPGQAKEYAPGQQRDPNSTTGRTNR